jgi:V/A-type H+-transporting ATPase subunit I
LNVREALNPVRMLKLRVLILDEYVDVVLTELQANAKIHAVNLERTLPRWDNLPQPYTAEQEIRKWQSLLNSVDGILTELGLKKELGLLEQLFKPRERALIVADLTREKELLNNADDLVANVETEIEDNIKKFRVVRDFLWELRSAKIDVEALQSTDRLHVTLGTIANEDIPALETMLRSRIRYVAIYTSGKKRKRFLAVVSLTKFSDEVQKILGEYRFQDLAIPKELSGDPSSCLRLLDAKINTILKKYEKQILHLYDAVQAHIERLKTKEKLGKTGRIFVLEAWVPVDDGDEIQGRINEVAQGYATTVLSDADEPASEIPTLLRDRKLLGSFRMLTEMYGVPLYTEIDPTPFTALFFIAFVGLMSADIAIGVTIIVAALLIRRGAGSRKETMYDLSVILLCIGVSAILFGILMGEFMGGLVALPVLWMSAAETPIDFLFVVIGIGMGHLVFGSMLGVLNNFHMREFRRMVGDQLSTLVFIGSATIFLSTGRFEFEGVSIVGYALGITGFVMLIGGKGLLGLLDLTRLLSNVISYVRILAINMATAWMSRTFVLLGSLVLSVYLIGPVLDGVILLFSHFFIVFISMFATFAHSLRLHYVEFFGRFFIGGGTKFSPLTAERAYTRLTTREDTVEKETEA